MKTIKILVWGLGIITMLVFQSCATIFGGRHNALVFENEQNVPAEVYIDDSLVGSAEGKLIIPKQVIQHGSVLEIRAEGYQSEEYIILRKVHTLYTVGNFAFGAVPLIVDYATGNILRPKPRKFVVELEKEN